MPPGCYFYSSDSAAVPDGRATVALPPYWPRRRDVINCAIHQLVGHQACPPVLYDHALCARRIGAVALVFWTVREISKRSPLTPAEVSDRSSGAPGFWNTPKFSPATAMTSASDTEAAAFWITLAHLPGKSSVQRSSRRIALHRTTVTPTAIHAHCGKGHDGSYPAGCQQTQGHTLSRRDGQNCHPHGYMPLGSPSMKLMRLPRQFRVQFRPL